MSRVDGAKARGIDDATALRRWVVRSEPGARCVYWSGDLASARKRSDVAAALGRAAYRAADDGLVRLLQARRSDEGFDYIAVRTAREKT